MKTTANTRSLLDIAERGEQVPKKLAEDIAKFVSDIMTDYEEQRKLLAQRQQEVINLAKANGELGLKVVDIAMELKPELEKLKKVVRLCVDANTREMQASAGPGIVDVIMDHPEKFNATRPIPIKPSGQRDDDKPEPTEIPPDGTPSN